MDAHYDQVQRARRLLEHAPSRLYFAYSTILDSAAFNEWKEQHGYGAFRLPAGIRAVAIDVDLIWDFPSRWWGGRVAGLTDRPGSTVHGLLFKIAGVDWPIIGHKEGAVTGMSVERQVRVRTDGADQEVLATAFVTNPQRASLEGPVSEKFIAALAGGAEAAGLPRDYVARIRRGG